MGSQRPGASGDSAPAQAVVPAELDDWCRSTGFFGHEYRAACGQRLARLSSCACVAGMACAAGTLGRRAILDGSGVCRASRADRSGHLYLRKVVCADDAVLPGGHALVRRGSAATRAPLGVLAGRACAIFVGPFCERDRDHAADGALDVGVAGRHQSGVHLATSAPAVVLAASECWLRSFQ